jgi:hypothetical protein
MAKSLVLQSSVTWCKEHRKETSRRESNQTSKTTESSTFEFVEQLKYYWLLIRALSWSAGYLACHG